MERMTGENNLRPVLSGLRVLEIGHFVAAPFCTRLLADLGADVIKIEPKTGDPVRQWGAQMDGKSLWWSMHGRNKRCITLNLKEPEARDIVLKLVEQSDALVENFRPGQLARIGLDPKRLREAKPDLIITHISGYGQDGPGHDRAAFGMIGEAVGGLRYLTNHPPGTTDLPPVRVGVSIGDSIAGLYAAFGLVAALWQRDRTGGDGIGRTVDVALTESVLSMMEGMLPEYGALGYIKEPTGGRIATAAPTNAYPTRGGGWILIGANSDALFSKLACLMGRPELVEDPAYAGNRVRVEHVSSLDAIIGEWTSRQEIGPLITKLDAEDIPNAKAYTAEDCVADPQYRARNMVREVEDPRFGRSILHAGIVPHIAETPGDVRWPGPEIGAHNEEVLVDLLGMPRASLRSLADRGII